VGLALGSFAAIVAFGLAKVVLSMVLTLMSSS
jgi:hypothetical protein